MKKTLLVLAVLLVLSGCGTNDTLTCTSDNTMGNITSTTTYVIEYKNDDVKKIMATYSYNDNHMDGVDTGTDGTTEDTDTDDDGIIDGVVGDAIDDVISDTYDGILDIVGIKNRHNDRFSTYTDIEGFNTKIDVDNDTDYEITYTYDLSKLTDDDITSLGIDRNYNTLRDSYTNRGMTCK